MLFCFNPTGGIYFLFLNISPGFIVLPIIIPRIIAIATAPIEMYDDSNSAIIAIIMHKAMP